MERREGGEIIIIAFAGWAIKWGEEVGNGVVYFLTKYEGEGKIFFECPSSKKKRTLLPPLANAAKQKKVTHSKPGRGGGEEEQKSFSNWSWHPKVAAPSFHLEEKNLLFALDRITLDAYLGNGSGSGKNNKRGGRKSFILFSR